MGYPGTSGCDFIDYIVADRMVVPLDQERFFSEKIAALPTTLWVTDTKRDVLPPPSRAEAGLPETGFVFCCFNHNWKITPPLFDIWMRLLQQVPGSVLWLGDHLPHIQQKLRAEAHARDVDPARLIFAQKRGIAEHLARHRLADLFLDTLPYNAHATAADALLAGLPVVTQLGEIFAGRVGASMAIAAGVPELVTQTAEDYEALALGLARDPARLAALRDKLNRREGPLFDSTGFVRGLEAAYLRMSGAQ
jgi:predicted O-linked N-acetylglucosamine transferase (SPINDLY family)